ncbi:MAG: hypothetical protein JJU27_09225 [Gammaproteobacteria bacterium]|nr:hypothetical protein [Gammaproteobacteria bacterium]
MKKILVAGLAGGMALMPLLASTASAEVTANVGWVSEYYYRGLPQKTSSASAGLDFDSSGFYLGTWAADVGDGAEIDLYGGYIWESGDFSLGLGATGYFYTGDFDDTYQEINFYAGYGPISAEFSIGEYDNFGGPKLDYTFYAITAEHNGFYGTFGGFGKDFEGTYAEAGYAFEVAGLDLSIAWVWSSKKLLLDAGIDATRADNTIIFGISKTFSLLD